MSIKEMQKEMKRFELAKSAMQGALANGTYAGVDEIVTTAIMIADKMLEELERTK